MAKKRKFLFGFDRQNVRFFFKSGYLDQEIQKAMNPDTLHPSPTARTTAAPCLPCRRWRGSTWISAHSAPDPRRVSLLVQSTLSLFFRCPRA